MEYKKIGLNKRSFSADAKRTNDELIKYFEEAENLLYWTESESMVLIEGPQKSGKTRLAFEVVENHKGEGKVIYLDQNTYNREIDISYLLMANQGFFRKFLNKKPKDMILILDNVINMDNDFFKRIQYYYDQGYLKSVIFIKKAGVELKLPKSILSRIGHKKVKLEALKKDECLEIAHERLRNFMDYKHLEKVWAYSKNLETLLKNAQLVADEFIIKDRKKLDMKFIDKVLK